MIYLSCIAVYLLFVMIMSKAVGFLDRHGILWAVLGLDAESDKSTVQLLIITWPLSILPITIFILIFLIKIIIKAFIQ